MEMVFPLFFCIKSLIADSLMFLALAILGTWIIADSTLIYLSSPLPDASTRSDGIVALAGRLSFVFISFIVSFTLSINFWLVGP